MPITTRHGEYTKLASIWKRNRTAYEGQSAVKAAKEGFLPRLQGHIGQGKVGDDKYEAFLASAHWLGMTKRTVEGLMGAATWKEPKVTLPESLAGIVAIHDIKQSIREQVIVGRQGLLVDADEEGNKAIRVYSAERIVNWHGENGAWRYVVIDISSDEPKDGDPFETETVERYLELGLDDDGFYFQRVWEQVGEGERKEWVPSEMEYPTRKEAKLPFIPFVMYGPGGLGASPEMPPISEVVDCNVAHYQIGAKYYHLLGIHATVQPYATGFSGVDDNGTPVSLPYGTGVLWPFGSPETKVGLLEPASSPFEAFERAMAAQEARAATMGARLLEQQKSAAETAETTRLRQSAEQSALASLSESVGLAWQAAIRMAAEWSGLNPEDCSIEMSRDFMSIPMSPEEFRELVRAWQSGAIPTEDYFRNLKEGERISPNWDFEEWVEALSETQTGQATAGPSFLPARQWFAR